MSEELEIIVCAKQIPDPEGPPSSFEADSDNKEVKISGIPPEINPFDKNALEAAIQLKEKHGGKVTVVSLGEKLSEAVLNKALGAGADELVLVKDKKMKNLDSYSTAEFLSEIIEKIGGYDLVLTGRQAGDWESGQVGILLSEFLELPGINWARDIEIEGGKVRVEKVIPKGYERVETDLPAVITASNEVGVLRYVSVSTLKKAREKPVKNWGSEKLDLSKLDKRNITSLTSPSRERECTIIERDTPEKAGVKLAEKLKEKGIV